MQDSWKSIKKELESYSLTAFAQRVLEEVFKIPVGQVRTYKQIANEIGAPRSYRAVGTALRKNPLPIIIPCHRVIKSSGELGRYSNGGTDVKRKLLLQEGALN